MRLFSDRMLVLAEGHTLLLLLRLSVCLPSSPTNSYRWWWWWWWLWRWWRRRWRWWLWLGLSVYSGQNVIFFSRNVDLILSFELVRKVNALFAIRVVAVKEAKQWPLTDSQMLARTNKSSAKTNMDRGVPAFGWLADRKKERKKRKRAEARTSEYGRLLLAKLSACVPRGSGNVEYECGRATPSSRIVSSARLLRHAESLPP